MSKSVALVLASGGARGLAQIGAIEELERRGYKIHSIASSSMGSVIGGAYASGHLNDLSEWMKSLDKSAVFQLLDFTFSLGFVKAERVFNHIRKIFNDPNIEDFEIDLKIIATNMQKEQEHIFDSGSLIDAMRASTAYPTVITPFMHNGEMLVDGGVLNPLPMNRVRRLPNDILVSIDLGAKIPYHAPNLKKNDQKTNEISAFASAKRIFNKYYNNNTKKDTHKNWSYFKLVTQTINVMHNQLNELALQHHAPDINIPISFRAADTFDFYRADELIEYGRMQAAITLDNYEASLKV
ncbi:MAG: patatin-like phospholipase family protein [Bacteroidales bacterium]|nr:patatin-like phospholipase family protein [Bacteroidales bacterium]